jgi:hypothetical protein
VAVLVTAAIADANSVMLVVGVEYTPHPEHYAISGISSTLDEYAYGGQPIPLTVSGRRTSSRFSLVATTR